MAGAPDLEILDGRREVAFARHGITDHHGRVGPLQLVGALIARTPQLGDDETSVDHRGAVRTVRIGPSDPVE